MDGECKPEGHQHSQKEDIETESKEHDGVAEPSANEASAEGTPSGNEDDVQQEPDEENSSSSHQETKPPTAVSILGTGMFLACDISSHILHMTIPSAMLDGNYCKIA